MLVDTNLIVYAVRPAYAPLRSWLIQQQPAYYSVISRVESLGFHRLIGAEHQAIQIVLDCLKIIYPTTITFEKAIQLRQQRRLSLGDSLIAATAMEHRLVLATANVEDFKWIHGLTILSPLTLWQSS
ncbi:MAG: type II toxin-antitoxin system VapC family toxin [Magnetococcales bacterium]|nr:type II toxin-antitoxin system VapC family toxin [Magnetococcales bacterium]